MKFRATIVLILGPLLWTACATSETSWLARSQEYYERGDFYQAFHYLETAQAEGEDREAIDKLYWPYRMAYLLKRAQMRVFAGEDVQALEDLSKVLALDPDNRIAQVWASKAKLKLAREATERGRIHLIDGDLEGALVEYHQALIFWPSFPEAEEGIRAVASNWQARRDKASERYLDGVRALAEQLFSQTQYHMLIAISADPTLDRAESSRQEASEQIRLQRFRDAANMVESGHYEAALREYRELVDHPDELPGVAEQLAIAQREVDAAALARDGEVALYQSRYDEARELLDRAFQLSTRERARYNDLLLRTREREFEDKYIVAKDLELQGQFEEAVERYRELEAEAPSFLDVRARLDNIQASIDLGIEHYEAGLAAELAGDLEAAIQHFEDVILHYPGYKDARSQLARLLAARAERS